MEDRMRPVTRNFLFYFIYFFQNGRYVLPRFCIWYEKTLTADQSYMYTLIMGSILIGKLFGGTYILSEPVLPAGQLQMTGMETTSYT